jgi:colanic acid/amylovoran biosynthesis glycosyltransferase
MTPDRHSEVAYVLKMFPRFSQTFVVNELLAHEAAGLPLNIFSMRLSDDTRFHESLARVQSPVTHILKPSGKSYDFLAELRATHRLMPTVLEVIANNPWIIASDMQQAMILARTVHERGIRHLHAHFGTIATTVSRLAAAMAGITYSFTAHAKDIFHESVSKRDFRSKMDDAAAVVTVSHYNLEHLAAEFPSVADRIVHIDNGLDLSHFRYEEPTCREPLVLGIGRFVEKKGFTYLIEACSEIFKAMPRARCEIIGVGVLEDELRSQIDRLGLQGSVRLLGPQPQEEVRRKLRQASVLAAPCVLAADGDRDGLPTVLLEAMAIGTPVVSTDVTGIPEILEDGVTGLAIPQRDSSALAGACQRLLEDAGLRKRLSVNARALIEKRFDICQNSAQLRALFGRILENRSN